MPKTKEEIEDIILLASSSTPPKILLVTEQCMLMFLFPLGINRVLCPKDTFIIGDSLCGCRPGYQKYTKDIIHIPLKRIISIELGKWTAEPLKI